MSLRQLLLAPQAQLLLSAGVSLLGFFITKRLIPLLKPYNIKANLFGYDINKKGEHAGFHVHLQHSCLLLEMLGACSHANTGMP